ncbi:MAG TPA: peptidoglycan DD-metalloendopeptidase family protein [Burkholderiales bacterium]
MKPARATGLCCLLVLLLAAGCASRPTSAPVVDRVPPKAPAAKPVAQVAAVANYVVKRGDTLYSVALEHGVDYRDVARWNRLEDPSRIRVGQSLRLTAPDEAQGAGAPVQPAKPEVQVGVARQAGGIESRAIGSGPGAGTAAQGDGQMRTAPKALRLPYSKENLALLNQPPPAAAPAAPASPPAVAAADPKRAAAPAPGPAATERESGAIEFMWPARGKLLAGFSEPNSKGVDIAGQPGDPVVAAAPGRVMYTGTGIRGYGKLIVIKHDEGYNSVYAHNREILVKEGQTVARGERIAELGDTDSDKPKLHFEIRKSGKPVDPMKYLPGDRPS